jgi:L-serine dehydratase
MTKKAIPVSIFNDVIGPVMRGPSSSHCAAALRIGRLARDVMDGVFWEVLVEYDNHGSLATTHHTQGSDMGLFAGLVGWDATDERLPDSEQDIRGNGIRVNIKTDDLHDPHPNTYHLTLSSETESHALKAISSGGGMIEVIGLDDFCLSMSGDYYETLVRLGGGSQTLLPCPIEADHVLIHEGLDGLLIQIKGQRFIEDPEIFGWLGGEEIRYIKRLSPALPVLSRKDIRVPFSTCAEMLRHGDRVSTPLWALALQYESERADLSPEDVIGRMTEITRIVRSSVERGIQGTAYSDRILGHQCGAFKQRMEAGGLLEAGVVNRIVLYVTALMEVKSAMGIIVAAPTAGACAALPGACLAVTDILGLTDDDAAKALLAGGIIGVFIATKSTFAAEVAGCQAECGSASGMAAAALATLAGANATQAVAAAAMALQNSLGMVCDPVANRVEVPCLGKNVMAATNALACANMALADYDPVVPLDEVIEAADRVGRALPRELRCTALGGLSVTHTSKKLEDRFRREHNRQTKMEGR